MKMNSENHDNYQFESLKKSPDIEKSITPTIKKKAKKFTINKLLIIIVFSLIIGFRWRYSFGGKLILINAVTVLLPYLIMCSKTPKKKVILQTLFAITTTMISYGVGVYGYSRDSVDGLLVGDKEVNISVEESYEIRVYTSNNKDVGKLNVRSSNPDIVDVYDGTGFINPKKPGKATVSFFDDYGNKVKSVVHVSKRNIPSRFMSAAYSVLKVGQSDYYGVGAVNGNVNFEFKAKDESVIGMYHSFMFALKEGSTRLDISSNTFPTFSKEVSVVGKDDYVWNICKYDCLRYEIGDVLDFDTVIPEDAENISITADQSLFKIEGNKVSVLKEGEGKINITYDDISYFIEFAIPKSKLQAASIRNYDGTKLIVNNPHSLEVKTYPSDALIESITYSSSNENVATVDQNGLITPLGKGITFININIDGNLLDIPVIVE